MHLVRDQPPVLCCSCGGENILWLSRWDTTRSILHFRRMSRWSSFQH